MEAICLKVFGRVQGVAFRYYTKQKADSLQLKGWVRNNIDGSVELVAVGKACKLELLKDWCKQGSPASHVDEVIEIESIGENDWKEFSILRK